MTGPHKCLFLVLFALAVFLSAVSLSWKPEHDLPLMLYSGFLIEELGRVPYRDIFDMNAPGALITYAALGRVTAFSPLGLRIVDLLLTAALSFIAFAWLRRINRPASAIAAVLWPVFYLGHGAGMALQRELFILILVALAGWLFVAQTEPKRFFIIGFLLGMAALIKPQSLITLPGIFTASLFCTSDAGTSEPRRIKRDLFVAFAGVAVPVGLCIVILAYFEALEPFLAIASEYWPLYGSLSGAHETIDGLARLRNLFDGFRSFGGMGMLLVPACLGLASARWDVQERKDQDDANALYPLAALLFAFGLYPALSGQFWPYHFLPFAYFAILASSLCVRAVGRPLALPRMLGIVALLFAAAFGNSWDAIANLASAPSPRDERVEAIVSYLEERTEPAATIQPLDWTGGAVAAMLETRSALATQFLYDFHFYHHVNSKYIRELRADFLEQLRSSHPEVVIRITAPDKPWVWGSNTGPFPELEALLSQEYHLARKGPGYAILERR
jgi:hypothetical protein